MGEAQGNLFEPDFNRSIKVQSTDQRLSSNAGVIMLRERVFAMALSYYAQDDLDCVAHDPAFRAAVWNRSGD